MSKRLLAWLSAFGLFVSMATLIAQLVLLSGTGPQDQPIARASASGITEFCINSVPSINVTCNTTLSQNTSYFCLLNYTDDQSDTVVFASNATMFNISSNGTIAFTPGNADRGNHTVLLIATDDSGCRINSSNTTFTFNVSNINDPPYLVTNLPNRNFSVNTTISAFYLNDYFADPDEDVLNYTSTIPAEFTVTIMPSSEVLFTANSCTGDGLITFTATDPFNASVDSNTLTITIECATSSSSSGGTGSGTGGGGGGAAFICKENWECEEWLTCLPTNFQWRRCYDLSGCNPEEYLKRSCDYSGQTPACQENWLCSSWSKCYANSTQQRSCRDLNSCTTEIVKPPLTQECVYQASCNDGVRNGDEEGVDCGGTCGSCALLQQPLPIVAAIPPWMLFLMIVAVLFVSGVLHYYRGQIAQTIATFGFLLKHRAYKDILLDAAQRKSYFERILAFEQLLASAAVKEMKTDAVYSTLANLIRQYYVDAFVVNTEAIPEEVAARCTELGVRHETSALAKSLFAKLAIIEQQDLDLDVLFVLATTEELRTLVCLTSDYHAEELMRPVEELPVDDKMSFYDEIFTRAINVLRAVQFNQIASAKTQYMEILNKYDGLSEQEKEQIYPELKWLFDATKFQSEITGAKVVKKSALA